jgi:cytochrome b pre-mRNA-processing protein 3
MLDWLNRRMSRRRSGRQIYERIVAQSRDPALYMKCGVPDTMDGRLEMVLLHTVLVLERLQLEGAAGQRLGQRLMEHLIADMDDSLRRIGLGDDSVSHRIKRLASAIAERVKDYRAAFADTSSGSRPDALLASLLEHVFAAKAGTSTVQLDADAAALADYTHRARARLGQMASREILTETLDFPAVFEPIGSGLETRP